MLRPASILALLALALCGCAGYRIGPTSYQTAGAKSVQIVPFINRSPEAGLADEVTSALRKSIQRDGTLLLDTHGGGDLVLSGALVEYGRREISLVSTDVRTVGDYLIRLKATVTVKERATGRVVFEKSVVGNALVRVGSDFAASERQAVPLLAQDLARQITDLLVDGSW
jgi:hypothetical protein